jgi:hypothetical protein
MSVTLKNSEQDIERMGPKEFVDWLCSSAMAGQAAILEDQLKAGIPLTYRDEHGNLVQKNPDGSITLLKLKEDIK